MMRSATSLASILLFSVLCLGACGGGSGDDDDDTATPDAAGLANAGFAPPEEATQANGAAADWDCLGTPTADTPTLADVNLTGVLTDFQNMDNEIREGTVEVFADIDHATVLDTFGPTDNTGAYSLTLPAGHARWGFRVTAAEYQLADGSGTFLLNQDFDAAGGDQSLNISAISNGVATALPAIIGLTRTPGTGVVAGAMRDCAGNEVSNAVATVSTTSGEAAHADGAVTYYLDSGSSLPVRHDQLMHTDTNGLFAVFELPVAGSSFCQVWGFVDAADLADGEMTLLAELEMPVLANTIVTGSIEPLRTN